MDVKRLPSEIRKIVPIHLGLKADEIVRQHCIDKFPVLRQGGNDLGSRPWRVQEKADLPRHTEPSQLSPEWEKMIFVHPDS